MVWCENRPKKKLLGTDFQFACQGISADVFTNLLENKCVQLNGIFKSLRIQIAVVINNFIDVKCWKYLDLMMSYFAHNFLSRLTLFVSHISLAFVDLPSLTMYIFNVVFPIFRGNELFYCKSQSTMKKYFKSQPISVISKGSKNSKLLKNLTISIKSFFSDVLFYWKRRGCTLFQCNNFHSQVSFVREWKH